MRTGSVSQRRFCMVLIGLALSATSAPRSQEARVGLDSNLQVSIRPLRSPIAIGSELSIEVVVRNEGAEVARVPVQLQEGIELHPLENGVLVPSSIVIEHLPKPHEPLADLAPGQQRSVVLTNVWEELGIVNPGQYSVVAEYWYRTWRDESGEHISMRQPAL